MKKMLITGGTVFVSRYIAEYYVAKGYEVYVLNRNNKTQSEGVKLIQADRRNIGESLRDYQFDIVIDVNAYTAEDVTLLLDAIGSYDDYILISSSAVYPETASQPFSEETRVGANNYWGTYGTDKVEAEKVLLSRDPKAYILRPPYLYGQMNNVYRESFVFDCALQNRKFYLPKEGDMKLQFFHVHDLCRFIDVILKNRPQQHIFNVGNKETLTIRQWVDLCYKTAGKKAEFVKVFQDIDQRNYFSFYDYEYYLDVSRQYEFMDDVKLMSEGLKEAYQWYQSNMDKVNKKSFFNYIDQNLVE